MTNPDVLKAKTVLAILEAIDVDDEDDAKLAVAMIRALLVKPETGKG